MEELSYVPNQYFVYCVHVLIFTLLAAPCWALAFPIVSPPLWIVMFSFLQNSLLLFSITRSSSFSVVHVSVNIKNNVEKDTTLLLLFLSYRPGGHAISFQIKPWVAFRLPYLLTSVDWNIWHWYACGAEGISGGRSFGVRSRDYQIFSDGWFTSFSYPWWSAACARAPLWIFPI